MITLTFLPTCVLSQTSSRTSSWPLSLLERFSGPHSLLTTARAGPPSRHTHDEQAHKATTLAEALISAVDTEHTVQSGTYLTRDPILLSSACHSTKGLAFFIVSFPLNLRHLVFDTASQEKPETAQGMTMSSSCSSEISSHLLAANRAAPRPNCWGPLPQAHRSVWSTALSGPSCCHVIGFVEPRRRSSLSPRRIKRRLMGHFAVFHNAPNPSRRKGSGNHVQDRPSAIRPSAK
ncbi:hypothetical protein V8E53_011841 [Lactarius tabidus]